MYMKIKQAKPLYQEYMELKPEHKKRILLSNLMRFKQNEPIIPVPPYEIEYHKKFKELTDAIQQPKS